MNNVKIALCSLCLFLMSALPAKALELEFYFPVAVGGSAANTIEKFADDYSAQNPDVTIKAIFCRLLWRHHHKIPHSM